MYQDTSCPLLTLWRRFYANIDVQTASESTLATMWVLLSANASCAIQLAEIWLTLANIQNVSKRACNISLKIYQYERQLRLAAGMGYLDQNDHVTSTCNGAIPSNLTEDNNALLGSASLLARISYIG